MNYYYLITVLLLFIKQLHVDGAPSCDDRADDTSACKNKMDECILPELPKNGYVTIPGNPSSVYVPGSKVPSLTILKFACNHSYGLIGNNDLIYCVGDKWIPEIPSCEKMCPPIETSKLLSAICYRDEYKVDCKKPLSGTRAKFTCASHYEDLNLRQYPFRFCKDGTWDRTSPNCVPECGIKPIKVQSLVGTPTQDVWPWVVGIYKKKSKEYFCGGTLINEKVILSTAHCFTDMHGLLLQSEEYIIAAGKHFRLFDHAKDTNAQYSEIEEIFIPTNYAGASRNFNGDISVVIVKEAFTLNNNVIPVCIDWGANFETEQLKSGTVGLIISGGGSTTGELQELRVPYYALSECVKHLPEQFKVYATPDKICSGSFNNSTSVCRGDSGMGYFFSKNDRYYIQGIASVASKMSEICGLDQYTLHTRISKYEDFIAEHESKYRSV